MESPRSFGTPAQRGPGGGLQSPAWRTHAQCRADCLRDGTGHVNLHVLEGANFSGRTRLLRDWVGLPSDASIEPTYCRSAYVGPDALGALSGIAPTVDAELQLHAEDRDALREARRAMEELGFGYCLSQNPLTLSGGEQVVTAIIAAAAARPGRLAVDCALEQLSPETRANLLEYLGRLDIELMLADNRIDEWYRGPTVRMHAVVDAPSVQLEAPLRLHREPCEIELVDLCHSYVKGRPILKNLYQRLEAGAHYLLKGPNGSGKTTMSKILCGLIKPTSGQIKVNGKPVQPWLTPGKYVSYHFQNPDYQLFASRVDEQINQSTDGATLARWFGLDGFLNDHPLDLPFVLKKRLAVACTLGRDTGFAILDEPTLGQDKASAINRDRLVASGLSGMVISHSQVYSGLREIHLPGR